MENSSEKQRPLKVNDSTASTSSPTKQLSPSPVQNVKSSSPASTSGQGPLLPSTPGTAGNTCSWILDLGIRIVTVQGKEYIGRVYTYDTIANVLILTYDSDLDEPKNLNGRKYSFRIIKINAIKSISPIDPTDLLINETKAQSTPLEHYLHSTGPLPQYVNLGLVTQRQRKNVTKAMEQNRRINRNAPEHGQEIFDAVSKMFPCSWDKTDIVVLDEVIIKAPYTPGSCIAISSSYDKTLDRVKKTVEAERKKLNIGSDETFKVSSPRSSSTASNRTSPSFKKDIRSNEGNIPVKKDKVPK